MASDIENPFLPSQIITNILTRLPIKSIVKFQCVCKQWKIIASSNGFICVAFPAEDGRIPTSYLVWNPMTNEVREVPPSLNNKNSVSVGFGYSDVVDDYKIVRFYEKSDVPNLIVDMIGYEMLYGVQVFSLRSGSWKELDLGDLLRYIAISPSPAHVNGTIFWPDFGSYYRRLIAFDIATDVFTIASIDSLSADEIADGELDHGYYPHHVYEHGNKLAMSCIYIDHVNDEVRVYNMLMWVVEEGAGELGKSYSCTGRYEFELIDVVNPMCFWRNQIVCPYIGNKAKVDISNRLHMFNLISKEWNKLPNFSDGYGCCAIFNYEKSLHTCLQHLG